MKYVVMQENYMDEDNVCRVADSLSEFVEEEYNYSDAMDIMAMYCSVFVCEDKHEQLFKGFYNKYWELKEKIISIRGLMPSKNDDELTLEERAQVCDFEAQINDVYVQAWNCANSLNLQLLNWEEVESLIDSTTDSKAMSDDELYIVTHSLSVNCGIEVYVDGIFSYAQACEVAQKYQHSEIRKIEIGNTESFMVGCYYE